MDKDNLLRVLIIEDSLNEAEQIVSLLRNAGYAVRPTMAEDEEELQQVIRQQSLDLVLCSTVSEEPTVEQVVQAVEIAAKDIPLIAVSDEMNPQLQLEVMQAGARDLTSENHPEHLQLVVERELKSLETRRQLRKYERSLRESERRCHTLLDSSRDAITYVHEGMHVYANPVYLSMFGFTNLADVEGMPIMDMVAPQDHTKFKEFLRQYSNGEEGTKELEVLGLRPEGNTFNATMEFSTASIDGEPCTQIIIRDRSVDTELEKKLKYLSKQDLLTGLYNRQYFFEELEQAIADATSGAETSAVLYIEPDNFKAIKESVGMAGSDLVLSDLAHLLQEATAHNDSWITARFGDNTFTILMRSCEADAAQALAERIRVAVENHISDVSGTSVTTTCSIGVGLVGETATSAQEILSTTDLACEMARKKGGNQAHLHNPVADEKAGKERDQQWINLIRQALEHDRFSLLYQPIASLHGETKEKYEVLVRMRDEEGKEILPNQFIPVAEKNNLVGAIDRWVIRSAIQILSERRRSNHDTTLFIKLSGDSLGDESLLPWMSEELKKSRLQGDSLVFEVPEASAVTHLKSAKTFVKGLKELRCGFALEHFGNGMNSFQLLKHLPADYLKIDGSFMHNLAGNQENQAMVKSITEMAHSMGKSVIAHFVEDASSLAVLWQCGVNYIQGHFLQEPDETMNYDFQGEEA